MGLGYSPLPTAIWWFKFDVIFIFPVFNLIFNVPSFLLMAKQEQFLVNLVQSESARRFEQNIKILIAKLNTRLQFRFRLFTLAPVGWFTLKLNLICPCEMFCRIKVFTRCVGGLKKSNI